MPFQVTPHVLPYLSGIYRSIDPLLGQGKENTVVGRADEKLSDRLFVKACVAG